MVLTTVLAGDGVGDGLSSDRTGLAVFFVAPKVRNDFQAFSWRFLNSATSI